jgi:hypothetical protein
MTRSVVNGGPGVLGSFAHVDTLVEAIDEANRSGFDILDVFSPVPVEGVQAKLVTKPSPVRFATFIGSVLGMIGGLALGILTATVWNTIVGGKPVANHVPFVVISFEGLILMGALGTFVGLIIAAGLPFRGFPGPAYREEFSKDRFGLWLGCADGQVEKAKALLEKLGAETVTRIEGQVERKGGG